MHRLFGILYLDDKRTDIDSKGNHLKRFKSFLNNDELIIKTKRKEMNRTYAIINCIDKSVNEYVEHSILDNKLFTKMGTCNWSMKINNTTKQNLANYMIDLTPNRIDFESDNIISVDPPNCVDIDDAISCKIFENHIEIAIHIADPSSYISRDSELGKELYNRIESLYIDDVQNMIPEDLSITHISLIEQKKSRAYSCIINIFCTDINKISEHIRNKNYDYKFVKTHIKVNKNLSYDDFEKNIYVNKYYKIIYDIGKEILIGFKLEKFEYDSHKMIEAYMLFCNHLAGISGLTNIKRINTIKEIKNVDAMCDKKLQELYNNCLQNSAKYVISNDINNNKTDMHAGLGLVYTHFTSPMRRYVDYLNHIIMYEKQSEINNRIEHRIEHRIEQNYIDKINDIHRYYKKIYNLQNINDLIDLSDNNLVNNNLVNQYYECVGKIIFIEDNMLRVLVNDKNIINNKTIINITLFNNKILDNKIIMLKEKTEKNIIFTYKEKEIKFELFQNINIKIYKIKLEINPFRIIINDILDFIEMN